MSKRRKRYSPTTIFIACEGTNTEPIYFERINEEIEENGQFVLTIYPDQNESKPKTDAMGLVKEARSRSKDFDEVWAVFDKNGYTLHEKAFKEAAKIIDGKKVHIAFSSISFEQWILLHFERSLTPFNKSAPLIDYLKSKNYYPTYSKKASIDTYTFLKDKTQTALENTAWLKTTMSSHLVTAKNNIFDVNPYCTVNSLVGKLLYNNTSIICLLLNESLKV